MRVVPLDSPLKRHQQLNFFNFSYFWSWIFDKSSKFWSAWCKNESNLLLVRIIVCIESYLHIGWLAHFHLMKNPPKCSSFLVWIAEFFTCEPQPKEQLISLPHFWRMVWQKRLQFEHMQTVNRTSRRIRGLFAWSGSELWSCFKYSRSKLKFFKHIAVDVLFKAYPMVPLSCRSNTFNSLKGLSHRIDFENVD